MTNTELALLELLKASLFKVSPQFPETVDWDEVFNEARLQSVVALAAGAVPPPEAGRWQLLSQQVQAEYMRLLYEQTQLVRLFEAHGIPLVILKGTAAAVYYPVPYRRSSGDVDILVPPERFEEAYALMEGSAYRLEADEPRHAEFIKNDVVFELHRQFSSFGRDIDPVLFDGISRAVRREVSHAFFPALPEDENGLVLLCHVRHHLMGGGLGVRQVLDWMMYVHAVLDDAAWEGHFRSLAQATGLETLAVTLTFLCKTYLGLPNEITWCDKADPKLAREVMELLLENGNFGIKTEESPTAEGAAVHIKREGIFAFLQRDGLRNWDAARKYPILRPFAWLYQIFRYIRRGVSALLRGEKIGSEFGNGLKKTRFWKRLGID